MCFGMKKTDKENCRLCSEPDFHCTYYVFGNVLEPRVCFKIGEEFIATEDVNHEDWKTVMARPDLYPVIKKGERVKFLGRFINMYGEFARVEYDGRRYDLNPNKLTHL